MAARCHEDGLRKLAGGTAHETWAFDLHDTHRNQSHQLVPRLDVDQGMLDGDLATEFELLATLDRLGIPAPRPRWCVAEDSPSTKSNAARVRRSRRFTPSRGVSTVLDIEVVSSDPAELRRAYGCFPSGVAAVCGVSAGTPLGMAASTCVAVSIAPPLVSVCVQNSSSTWPRLRQLDRIGVSLLAEDQHAACRSLADKEGDRFAGVSWEASNDGAIFLTGATAWLDCSLHAELIAGDHAIALLEIHRIRSHPEHSPLIFHASRFRQLAKIT